MTERVTTPYNTAGMPLGPKRLVLSILQTTHVVAKVTSPPEYTTVQVKPETSQGYN